MCFVTISVLRDESRLRMMLTSTTAVLMVSGALVCASCGDLAPRDVSSMFIPTLQRSEIVGFFAGLGTTFAAVPDLVGMFRRRSTVGMNPRLAAFMGVFQVLWIYYCLLITSRPVIGWNVIGVVINLSVGLAYRHFLRRERADSGQ